jgi:Cu+-exporting ATPase
MTSHDIAHDHLAENARARTMTQVAKGHGKSDQHEREHALEWTELARIGFVAPLAILGGIGRAARLGAIIKGGLYLETLGRVDTIVLDKTGTLTFGRPEVQTVVPADGISPDAVLEAAAIAELRSEHPLGKAIVTYARTKSRTVPEPEDFNYTPGRGIVARSYGAVLLVGNQALMKEHGVAVPPTLSVGMEAASEILVARDGQLLGKIIVADTIRPEAKGAIAALARLRMRTRLLPGIEHPRRATVASSPASAQARLAQTVS